MDLRHKLGAALVALTITMPAITNAAAGPDPSYLGFLATGATASALEAQIDNFLLTKSVNDFGYSIYQQGRTYNGGSGGQQQEQTSSTPQLDFVNKHKNAYCSTRIKAEATGFGCKPPNGASADDAKYLELGDINFSSIMDPTVYTAGTDVVAQNLIRNIVSPFPDPKYKAYITTAGFMDQGDKKTEYANFMAGQAILGVALYSLNEIYGVRTPGSSLGIGGNNPGANTSWMQMFQTQSTQRFEQTDWVQYLSATTTTDSMVFKEMAAMQAYQIWMQYQSYMQMERIEALLAAALAKMVNDSYAQTNLINSVSNSSTAAMQGAAAGSTQ